MAAHTVRLMVELTINEGKAEQLERLAQEMIAGSQREAGTLGYDFFLSSDGKRCHLIETYADADALVAHFAGPVVQQLVPKMVELVKLDRSAVYGDLTPKAFELLTAFGAEILKPWHLLNR